jgi:hypothetical protein
MNADASASPALERTKSSLCGRLEAAEGLPFGPFKVFPRGSLGLISVQHHEGLSYTLIENHVKGSRSQLESFGLQTRTGERRTLIVALPCAPIFRCDLEKIFVLLSGSVSGVDSRRVSLQLEQN